MLQEQEELRDGLSPLHSPVALSSPGTHFTCFTSAKVQILTEASPGALSSPGTQFTCFTSTKVQILTPVAPASQDQKRNRPVPTKGNTASREDADAALLRGIKARLILGSLLRRDTKPLLLRLYLSSIKTLVRLF
jgi:hypothetical protein